jgi:hypothetical protein
MVYVATKIKFNFVSGLPHLILVMTSLCLLKLFKSNVEIVEISLMMFFVMQLQLGLLMTGSSSL